VLELTGPVTVRLTWQDNSTNETYFHIERSLDAGASWTQAGIVVANSTTWTNYSLLAETEYHFRIRASNGIASSYSNVASILTGSAPAAPSDLAVSNINDTKLTLTWTDNANSEQFYRVERSLDGSTFSQVAVLGANSTTWTPTNLAPGTTYYFRVRASVGTLYSGYSPIVVATTASEPVPPATPSNLVATTVSATSIALSWTDNATGEQYSFVERSTDGINFAQVAQLAANTTSWTSTGLAPSTTYDFRVRVRAGTVYSSYSNVASATTQGGPLAPSNLQATPLSASSVRLNWIDNSSDEQYFHIERSTDGLTFTQVGLVVANSTTWTNSSLAAGTTYHYRVKASKSGIPSLYSNTVSVATLPPPTAPSNLAATPLGPDRIQLTWIDNSTDEQFFRVERSVDGVNFSQVATLGANATSWTNSNLVPATTYFYRMRAQAGGAYSGFSNTAVAETDSPPAAPSGLAVTVINGNTLRIGWTDNATNEQYYRIERSTDGINFAQAAIVVANSTTWTNYGLLSGTKYYYRVRASVGSAYSGYSEVASATTP
jgi:titin